MESIVLQRMQTATTAGALAALAELCDYKEERGRPPLSVFQKPMVGSRLIFPALSICSSSSSSSSPRPATSTRIVASPRIHPYGTLGQQPIPVSPLGNNVLPNQQQEQSMVREILSASLSLAELSKSPVVFQGESNLVENVPSDSTTSALSTSSATSASSKQVTSLPSIQPRTQQPPFLVKTSVNQVAATVPAEASVVSSSSSSSESQTNEERIRFREYQVTTWSRKLEEVQAFVRQHGHCTIPSDYPPNQKLAKWAKRQRCQYQLFQSNPTKSSMTLERIRVLEDLGFCWQNKMSVWQARYEELLQFHLQCGHTQVPSSYKPNQRLATWVKCQRRQKRLRDRGKSSSMTNDRIALLDSVNFVWRMYPSNPREESSMNR